MRTAAVGRFLVIGVLIAVIAVRLSRLYEPYTFLIGDCPYYAATAISVLSDHDFDLRNQLNADLAVHANQISLGARGEWYPKHPVLMPLVSVPLLATFGMNGFLIGNVIVLLGLAVVLYEASRLFTSPVPAAAGVLATILGSFVIRYDYNYSPNLFGTLLLALSVFALFRARFGRAGVFGGLGCFAYTPNFIPLPVLVGYAAWKGRLRGMTLFIAGAAPAVLALGALNLRMFGSPFISPYMRIVTIQDGTVGLHSNAQDFTNPLWDGIRDQLVDPSRGLLFTAPVLLLAIPGYALWIRGRRDAAVLCLLVGGVLFLAFSRYGLWATSSVGNRFLIPLVALSAPAVACTLEWTLERFRLSAVRHAPRGNPSDRSATSVRSTSDVPDEIVTERE